MTKSDNCEKLRFRLIISFELEGDSPEKSRPNSGRRTSVILAKVKINLCLRTFSQAKLKPARVIYQQKKKKISEREKARQ